MIQTGYMAKRILRVPLVGKYLYAGIVNLCGALTGHPRGTDWGFAADGSRVDVWCRWCDCFQQIDADKADAEVRSTVYRVLGKDIRRK